MLSDSSDDEGPPKPRALPKLKQPKRPLPSCIPSSDESSSDEKDDKKNAKIEVDPDVGELRQQLPVIKDNVCILSSDDEDDSIPLSQIAKKQAKIEVDPDVGELRQQLSEIRDQVLSRELEDNASFDKGLLPGWRDQAGCDTLTHKKRSLEQLMASSDEYISYTSYVAITQHQSLISMLGGSSGYNPLLRSSNKESRTLEFALESLEMLLKDVAKKCGSFSLTPAQRLAVGIVVHRKLIGRIHCAVSRFQWRGGAQARLSHKAKHKSTSELAIAANTSPMIFLNNFATGNGKTHLSILMAMTPLVHDHLWQQSLKNFGHEIDANSVVRHAGIIEGGDVAGQKLARVCIAFIPLHLHAQWLESARMIAVSMEAEFGSTFELWHNMHKLERKSSESEGKARDMEAAEEWTRVNNKALLWLVPIQSDIKKMVALTLRCNPDIVFPCRIYDEMSKTTEARGVERESQSLFTIVANATPENVSRATQYQPRHPLRLCLENQNFSPTNTKHAAMFHLMTTADWLRALVSQSMSKLMPSGIHKITLRVQVQSLASRVVNADLNITSIDELLTILVHQAGGFQPDEMCTLTARCKHLLGIDKPDNPDNPDNPDAADKRDECDVCDEEVARDEGKNLSERLKDAIKNATAEVQDQTDVKNQLQAAINAVVYDPGSPPDDTALREVEKLLTSLHTMKRLFGRLQEVFCLQAEEQPLDPVTLEPILPKDLLILPCCTNVMDRTTVALLRDKRCPYCRAPLVRGFVSGQSAVEVLTSKKRKKPDQPKDDAHDHIDRRALVGNEALLHEGLSKMSSMKFSGSLKAVSETIAQFLKFKPHGARILLAYACYGSEVRSSERLRSFLKETLPELTSAEAVNDRKPWIVKQFKDEPMGDVSNRLIVINTANGSSSLEGLDFPGTDLIIVDKTAINVPAATMVQCIGRVMRPQKRQKATPMQTPGEAGPSNAPHALLEASHPAKLVVMLESRIPG